VTKFLMPGPDGGGWLMTSLLGIAGALVGGSIASAIGLASFTGFNMPPDPQVRSLVQEEEVTRGYVSLQCRGVQ
jgi:hypothetical protein